MKKIAIIGAGGFGREAACLLDRINKIQGPQWEFIGFFDSFIPKGERGVIGTDDDLNQWPEPLNVVIAIGNPEAIRKIASKITNPLIQFPNICAPDLIIADTKSARMGRGNIFTYQCVVSCNVEIGDFNIFNGTISIGHDAVIGSYNAVMPAVRISGSTQIGDCNFFGVNSIVLQGVKIGSNIRLGAGSVLIRNTKDSNLYMGNPATIVKL